MNPSVEVQDSSLPLNNNNNTDVQQPAEEQGVSPAAPAVSIPNTLRALKAFLEQTKVEMDSALRDLYASAPTSSTFDSQAQATRARGYPVSTSNQGIAEVELISASCGGLPLATNGVIALPVYSSSSSSSPAMLINADGAAVGGSPQQLVPGTSTFVVSSSSDAYPTGNHSAFDVSIFVSAMSKGDLVDTSQAVLATTATNGRPQPTVVFVDADKGSSSPLGEVGPPQPAGRPATGTSSSSSLVFVSPNSIMSGEMLPRPVTNNMACAASRRPTLAAMPPPTETIDNSNTMNIISSSNDSTSVVTVGELAQQQAGTLKLQQVDSTTIQHAATMNSSASDSKATAMASSGSLPADSALIGVGGGSSMNVLLLGRMAADPLDSPDKGNSPALSGGIDTHLPHMAPHILPRTVADAPYVVTVRTATEGDQDQILSQDQIAQDILSSDSRPPQSTSHSRSHSESTPSGAHSYSISASTILPPTAANSHSHNYSFATPTSGGVSGFASPNQFIVIGNGSPRDQYLSHPVGISRRKNSALVKNTSYGAPLMVTSAADNQQMSLFSQGQLEMGEFRSPLLGSLPLANSNAGNSISEVGTGYETSTHAAAMFIPPALLGFPHETRHRSGSGAAAQQSTASPPLPAEVVYDAPKDEPSGVGYHDQIKSHDALYIRQDAGGALADAFRKLLTITDTLMLALKCERQRRRKEGKALVGEIVRQRSNVHSRLASPILAAATAANTPIVASSASSPSHVNASSTNVQPFHPAPKLSHTQSTYTALSATVLPSATTNDLATINASHPSSHRNSSADHFPASGSDLRTNASDNAVLGGAGLSGAISGFGTFYATSSSDMRSSSITSPNFNLLPLPAAKRRESQQGGGSNGGASATHNSSGLPRASLTQLQAAPAGVSSGQAAAPPSILSSSVDGVDSSDDDDLIPQSLLAELTAAIAQHSRQQRVALQSLKSHSLPSEEKQLASLAGPKDMPVSDARNSMLMKECQLQKQKDAYVAPQSPQIIVEQPMAGEVHTPPPPTKPMQVEQSSQGQITISDRPPSLDASAMTAAPPSPQSSGGKRLHQGGGGSRRRQSPHSSYGGQLFDSEGDEDDADAEPDDKVDVAASPEVSNKDRRVDSVQNSADLVTSATDKRVLTTAELFTPPTEPLSPPLYSSNVAVPAHTHTGTSDTSDGHLSSPQPLHLEGGHQIGRAGRLPVFVASGETHSAEGGHVLDGNSSKSRDQTMFGSSLLTGSINNSPPSPTAAAAYRKPLIRVNTIGPSDLTTDGPHRPMRRRGDSNSKRLPITKSSSKSSLKSKSGELSHRSSSKDCSAEGSKAAHLATIGDIQGGEEVEEEDGEASTICESSVRNISPKRRRSTAAQSEVGDGDSEFTAEENDDRRQPGTESPSLLATIDDGTAISLPPQSRRATAIGQSFGPMPTTTTTTPAALSTSQRPKSSPPPQKFSTDDKSATRGGDARSLISLQFDHTFPSEVPSGVVITGAAASTTSYASTYPSHSLTAPPSMMTEITHTQQQQALMATANTNLLPYQQSPFTHSPDVLEYGERLFILATQQMMNDNNGAAVQPASTEALLTETFGHPADPRTLWFASAPQLQSLLWHRQSEFEHEQRELAWLLQQRQRVDAQNQFASSSSGGTIGGGGANTDSRLWRDGGLWQAKQPDGAAFSGVHDDSTDFAVFTQRKAKEVNNYTTDTASSSFTAYATTIPNTISEGAGQHQLHQGMYSGLHQGPLDPNSTTASYVGALGLGQRPFGLDSTELSAHTAISGSLKSGTLTSPNSTTKFEGGVKSPATSHGSRFPLTPTAMAPQFLQRFASFQGPYQPQDRRHSPPSFSGGGGSIGQPSAFSRINESFMDSSFVQMTNNYVNMASTNRGLPFASHNPSVSSSFTHHSSMTTSSDPYRRFMPGQISPSGRSVPAFHFQPGSGIGQKDRATANSFTPPTTLSGSGPASTPPPASASPNRIDDMVSPSHDRVSSAAQDSNPTRGPSAVPILEGTINGPEARCPTATPGAPSTSSELPSALAGDVFGSVKKDDSPPARPLASSADGPAQEQQQPGKANLLSLPTAPAPLADTQPLALQLMFGDCQTAPHASLLSLNSAFVNKAGFSSNSTNNTFDHNQIIRFGGAESSSLGDRVAFPASSSLQEISIEPPPTAGSPVARRTVDSPTDWSPSVRNLSAGHSQSGEFSTSVARPPLSLDQPSVAPCDAEVETTPLGSATVIPKHPKGSGPSFTAITINTSVGSKSSGGSSSNYGSKHKDSPMIPTEPVPTPSHRDRYVPSKQRRPSFVGSVPVASSTGQINSHRDPAHIPDKEVTVNSVPVVSVPALLASKENSPKSSPPQQGILVSGTHSLDLPPSPRKSPGRVGGPARERSIKMLVPSEDEATVDSAHVSPSRRAALLSPRGHSSSLPPQHDSHPSEQDENAKAAITTEEESVALLPVSSANTKSNTSNSSNLHIDRYIPGGRQHRPSYCEVSLNELSRKGADIALANKLLREARRREQSASANAPAAADSSEIQIILPPDSGMGNGSPHPHTVGMTHRSETPPKFFDQQRPSGVALEYASPQNPSQLVMDGARSGYGGGPTPSPQNQTTSHISISPPSPSRVESISSASISRARPTHAVPQLVANPLLEPHTNFATVPLSQYHLAYGNNPNPNASAEMMVIPTAVEDALRLLSGAATEDLAWLWLRHEIERRGGSDLINKAATGLSGGPQAPFVLHPPQLETEEAVTRNRGVSTISGIGSSHSGDKDTPGSWPPSRTTSLPPTAPCAFQSPLAPPHHNRPGTGTNSFAKSGRSEYQMVDESELSIRRASQKESEEQEGRAAISPSHDLMHEFGEDGSPRGAAAVRPRGSSDFSPSSRVVPFGSGEDEDESSGSPPSHQSQSSKENGTPGTSARRQHTRSTSIGSSVSPGVSNLVPLTAVGSHSHLHYQQLHGRDSSSLGASVVSPPPLARRQQQQQQQGMVMPHGPSSHPIPNLMGRTDQQISPLPIMNFQRPPIPPPMSTFSHQFVSSNRRAATDAHQFVSTSSTAYGGGFIGVGGVTPRTNTNSATTSGKASPAPGLARDNPLLSLLRGREAEPPAHYQSSVSSLQQSPLMNYRGGGGGSYPSSNPMLRSSANNNVAVASYVAEPSMPSISQFIPQTTFITGVGRSNNGNQFQSTRSNNYNFSPTLGPLGGAQFSVSSAAAMMEGRLSGRDSTVLMPRESLNLYGQFSNGLQSASNLNTAAAVWHEQREMLRQLKAHHSEAAKGPGVQRNMGTVGAADDGFDVINQYTILDTIGRGTTGSVLLAFDTKIEKFFAVKQMGYSTVRWQRELELRKVLAAKRNSLSLSQSQTPSLWGSSLPPKSKTNLGRTDKMLSTNPNEVELPPEEMVHPVDKEIQIMRSLHHPNIVELIEVIEDEEEQTIYLVMTYAKHGALTSIKADLSQSAYCNQLALVSHITPQPSPSDVAGSPSNIDDASNAEVQNTSYLGASPPNASTPRLVPITVMGTTPISVIEGSQSSTVAIGRLMTVGSGQDDPMNTSTTLQLNATINDFSASSAAKVSPRVAPVAALQLTRERSPDATPLTAAINKTAENTQSFANVAGSPSAMETRLSAPAENDGDGYLKILPSKYRLVCDPIRPLRRLRCLSKQIVEAIYYMHVFRHLVHRDIKPDNILMNYPENGEEVASSESDEKASSVASPLGSNDQTPLKKRSKKLRPQEGSKKWGRTLLTDFGQTERFHSDAPLLSPLRLTGTPAFFAPEVCNGDESGTAADIWSLGVTLFSMVFGMLPFAGRITRDMVEEITEGALAFPDIGTEKMVCWLEAQKRKKTKENEGGSVTKDASLMSKSDKSGTVAGGISSPLSPPLSNSHNVPTSAPPHSSAPDHSLCEDGPSTDEIMAIVAPYFEGDDSVKDFTLEQKCESVITSMRWWKDLLSQTIRKNPNMRPSIRWVQRHHIFQTPLAIELHMPSPIGHAFADSTSRVGGDLAELKQKMLKRHSHHKHISPHSGSSGTIMSKGSPVGSANGGQVLHDGTVSSCDLSSLSPTRNQLRSSTRAFNNTPIKRIAVKDSDVIPNNPPPRTTEQAGKSHLQRTLSLDPKTPPLHRTYTIAPNTPLPKDDEDASDKRNGSFPPGSAGARRNSTSIADNVAPPVLLSVAFAGSSGASANLGGITQFASASSALTFPTLTTMDSSSVVTGDLSPDFATIAGDEEYLAGRTASEGIIQSIHGSNTANMSPSVGLTTLADTAIGMGAAINGPSKPRDPLRDTFISDMHSSSNTYASTVNTSTALSSQRKHSFLVRPSPLDSKAPSPAPNNLTLSQTPTLMRSRVAADGTPTDEPGGTSGDGKYPDQRPHVTELGEELTTRGAKPTQTAASHHQHHRAPTDGYEEDRDSSSNSSDDEAHGDADDDDASPITPAKNLKPTQRNPMRVAVFSKNLADRIRSRRATLFGPSVSANDDPQAAHDEAQLQQSQPQQPYYHDPNAMAYFQPPSYLGGGDGSQVDTYRGSILNVDRTRTFTDDGAFVVGYPLDGHAPGEGGGYVPGGATDDPKQQPPTETSPHLQSLRLLGSTLYSGSYNGNANYMHLPQGGGEGSPLSPSDNLFARGGVGVGGSPQQLPFVVAPRRGASISMFGPNSEALNTMMSGDYSASISELPTGTSYLQQQQQGQPLEMDQSAGPNLLSTVSMMDLPLTSNSIAAGGGGWWRTPPQQQSSSSSANTRRATLELYQPNKLLQSMTESRASFMVPTVSSARPTAETTQSSMVKSSSGQSNTTTIGGAMSMNSNSSASRSSPAVPPPLQPYRRYSLAPSSMSSLNRQQLLDNHNQRLNLEYGSTPYNHRSLYSNQSPQNSMGMPPLHPPRATSDNQQRQNESLQSAARAPIIINPPSGGGEPFAFNDSPDISNATPFSIGRERALQAAVSSDGANASLTPAPARSRAKAIVPQHLPTVDDV